MISISFYLDPQTPLLKKKSSFLSRTYLLYMSLTLIGITKFKHAVERNMSSKEKKLTKKKINAIKEPNADHPNEHKPRN